MSTLPLVFEAPRRGKPPIHLADLDRDARRAAVTELGLPAFRADQLARQYFTRFEGDAGAMTDIPADRRDEVGAALLPTLLTGIRTTETDDGTTRKTLWRLHDGALVESVLMRYPPRTTADGSRTRERITVCISSQAGCGMACPFCATGQGGLTRNLSTAEIVEQVRMPPPAVGRDRRAGRRAGPAVQRRVHGHGRAAGQRTRRLLSRAAPADRLRRRTASGCPVARSRCRPSGWSPAIGRLADAAISMSPSPCRCTHRTTNCATRSCRSTPAGRSPRCLQAADDYAAAHRAAVLDRVRDDPRRQRPGLACRAAG